MLNSRSTLVDVYRDDRGIATAGSKASTGRRGILLANYLMSDIQGDPYTVNEILNWLSKIEDGEVEDRENDGNAYNLIMQPNGARIEDLIVEEELPEEYTLEEIRAALEDWGALLDQIIEERSG